MHERLTTVDTMSLLHLVRIRDKEKIKNLILQNKTKLNIDKSDALNEENPLFLACCYGDEDIVKLLLSNGANVNFRNAWNSTPLFGAVDNDHPSTVRLLIRYGAMLNVQNDHGDTVLHIAAYRGHCDIVRLLLRHGAPSTVRNKSGKSCLNEAESRGHTEIIEILKNHSHTNYIGQSSHSDSKRQATFEPRKQMDEKVNLSLLPDKHSRNAPNMRTTRSLLQTSHPRLENHEMSFVEPNHDECETPSQLEKETNHSPHFSLVQLEHSPRHKLTDSANVDVEGSEFQTLRDSSWNIPPNTSCFLYPPNDNTSMDSNFNSINGSEKSSLYSNKDIFR